MKSKFYKLFSGVHWGLIAFVITLFSASSFSQTYLYTGGQQSVALPAGTYGIQMWGANGGNSNNSRSGIGGYSTGTLNLASTTTLYIVNGGVPIYTGLTGIQPGGYNGGGTGYANATGRAGGGATHIATVSGTLGALQSSSLSVIMVAGGGGGDQNSGLIGHGGGLSGGGTYPGTQTGSNGGIFGAFGQGGDITVSYGGGGGGGWFGGGGNQNNAGSGGSGYVGGVSTGSTIMSGSTGFVANPDANGNGRVIITTLCNITVNNSSTTGPGPICIGNSATLTTNAISNYAWSNGSNTSSIVVSPTVTTSYTLTATSPLNCVASAVITVTVDSNTPTVTAATSQTAVCAGNSVTLSGGGANTYTWSNGALNGVPYLPLATNMYTVTGANACTTATAAVGVTVNTSPVVQGGVNSPTVCSGSSVTFTSGGNATTYIWTAGVQSNVPYFPTITNNYTLTGTANGCSSVSVVGVTVLVTPSLTPIANPTAICIGGSSTLTATGASSYSWIPGNNLTTSSVVVSPTGPTTYTLYRTNGTCSNTSTLTVMVNPLPLVNASASPSQICTGTGVNMVVVGPITNTWLPGGFTMSNFTLYPNSSTNYTVTGSNGNCTASVVVPVIVNPTPNVSILTSTNTVCAGQSATLTAGGVLGFTWSPSGNINNTTEVVTPPSTTLVTLTGTNSFGCSASIQQLIVVNPIPDMTINSSLPFVCANQSAVLSIANPSTMVVYNWNTGPSGTSLPVSPQVTTTYSVTGTNTVTGCQASNSASLAVYISTFVVTSPTAVCKGESATLIASGPASSYTWNVSPPVNSASLTVSPQVNTVYNVTGSNGSCQNTQSVSLIVNPIPNVTALAAKTQICRFEVSTIVGSGANTYSWSTGASTPTISFTLSLTTTYTLTGTDLNNCSKTVTVTQFVATCIGLEDVTSNGNFSVDVYPNPNNGNFTISAGASLTLDLVNSIGQIVKTVQFSQENQNEITVSDLPSGIYFLRARTNGINVNKKLIVER